MSDTIVGDPAATATPTARVVGGHPRTTPEIVYDAVTVFALIAGGLVVPVAGWVAGVVLLWHGPRWSARHRWAGSLAWPVAILAGLGVLAAADRDPIAIMVGGAVVGTALVAVFAWLSVAAARTSR